MELISWWESFKSFFRLSVRLAKAQFKLKNEGSYLGILWYLLNPVLLFVLLLLVFSNNLGKNIQNYPIYLLLGIIIFNFFQQITISSITNMRDHRLIIKSINFPKEALVASNVLKTLFSHTFEIIVFIIVALFFEVSVKGFIFYIPILVFYCTFIYGLSLILASLYVYFIDVEHIWNFFSRLLFFITPIFYIAINKTNAFYVNLFNPLYYFLTIAREIIIYNKTPELWMILVGIAYSLLFFAVGTLIFNKLKIKFSELM